MGLHRMLVGTSLLPTMSLDVLQQAEFHASQLDGGPLLSTYKKLVFFRELHSSAYMFYTNVAEFHGAGLMAYAMATFLGAVALLGNVAVYQDDGIQLWYISVLSDFTISAYFLLRVLRTLAMTFEKLGSHTVAALDEQIARMESNIAASSSE